MWCDYGYSEEEEKPTEESIGLSLDEAKKLVKEKVEKMGITDLQFSNWNYAVCKSFEGDNSSGNFGNGYRIDYARTINGVPGNSDNCRRWGIGRYGQHDGNMVL